MNFLGSWQVPAMDRNLYNTVQLAANPNEGVLHVNKLPIMVLLAVVSLIAFGVPCAEAKSFRPGNSGDDFDKRDQSPSFSTTLSSESLKDDDDDMFRSASSEFNGKQGISTSAIHRGPRSGVVSQGPSFAAVTPNPEPTTLLLLGTGLAAVGGVYRRKRAGQPKSNS
ncbi:MAG: hypothetical protein C5B55_00505 [Blastocatellia bacterium]|nr:MAG: hypothetical protein C5B55_00505 [Blastocatellia bacterium]